MGQKTYSAYQLLPDTPSATKWIIEDAAKLPEKLRNLLDAAGPTLVGQANLGETYKVESISWKNDPRLDAAFHNEMVTRDLEVAWICTKNSAGQRSRFRLKLTIPDVPFPNAKGAYAYGADEYFITAQLKQKHGIFPVSSETRKTSEKPPEILWETPLATFLQNEDTLLVQVRRKTGESENRPISIPKALWGELGEVLERYRTRTNSRVNFNLLPDENSELRNLVAKGLDYQDGERVDFQLDRFFQTLAEEKVPTGAWSQRLDDLRQTYPEISEDLKTLQTERHWSPKTARAAARICSQMPSEEFLPVGHMGRLHVRTGTDIINTYLYAEIRQAFQEARTHNQKKENLSLTLEIPWVRRSWARDLTRLFLSPAVPKMINEEPTPQSIAIKANLIKNNFQAFAPTKWTNAPGTSDIERTFHPSAIGAVAVPGPESANVGVDHWMCGGARRNPETGEIERPIMQKQADGTYQKVWMNPEGIERLERQLAEKNQGIHLGVPDKNARIVPLRRNLNLVGQCRPDEVLAYLDYKPEDMLPLHLAMANNVSQIAQPRMPMLHAGQNNARTVNGSEAPKVLSPEAKAAADQLTNVGVMLVAPASGTVTKIKNADGLNLVTIQDEKGDEHICEIPTAKANAFKALIGTVIYLKVGDEVQKGHVIAGPDHHAYRSQVAGKPPAALHCTVNLKGVILSQGIEDQIIVSSHVLASGRLDQVVVEKEATERPDYPIYIKKFQPGTMIRPNETLAFQIVEGKEVPIITGPNQGGILQKVTLVQDLENPVGNGTPVHISDEALTPPSLREIIEQELKEDLAKLFELRQQLDPKYIVDMQNRGLNPLPCIDTFEATYLRDNNRQKVSIPLADLAPGKAGRTLLIDLLADPHTKLTIDKGQSYLNERLYYTQQRIQGIRDLIAHPTPKNEISKFAKEVVFEIQRVIPFQLGSKMSDNSGTKGVIRTNPYLPIISENGTLKPAEIAVTSLAVIARGALGWYFSTDAIQKDEVKQETFLRNQDGSLSKVNVQTFDAVEKVQKSAPSNANKDFANPKEQGRDFRGVNKEGGNLSPESNVLAASMKGYFNDLMVEPSTPTLSRMERTSNRILKAAHQEILRLKGTSETPEPAILQIGDR